MNHPLLSDPSHTSYLSNKISLHHNSFNVPAHCAPVLVGTAIVGAKCTGFSSVSNCGQEQETFSVQDFYIHPDHNEENLSNDFAVVKLNGHSTITPARLDNGSYSPTYTSGKSIGIRFGLLQLYYQIVIQSNFFCFLTMKQNL